MKAASVNSQDYSSPMLGVPEASDVKGRVLLRGIEKTFGTGAAAVSGIDLDIQPGQFVSLLGPSGCGKTTTLRMVAGLETPDVGQIDVDGRTMFSSVTKKNVAAQKRHLGFVFQNYALWPHMTVAENIAYPLRRRRLANSDIAARLDRVLNTLQCSELADRHPSELSGGQQQRVALGRAIVNPTNSVILFDEPLSNLDARLRDELRVELRSLQTELRFTAIYVTHDRAEAMSMSDSLVVMSKGKIERTGSPIDVTIDPQKESVASLLGTYNYLNAEIIDLGRGAYAARTRIGQIPLVGALKDTAQGDVRIALPKHSIAINSQHSPSNANQFSATIENVSLNGENWDVSLRVDNNDLLEARVRLETLPNVGQEVSCVVAGSASVLNDDTSGEAK